MGLFNLIFRIGTDNTDFDKGINAARSSAERAASGMSAAFKRHLAAAFSIGAISAASKKVIDYGSHNNDLAEASGIAREQIQELDYAMKQNGATVEDAVKAARELSKARAEALKEPEGDKARAFQQFGIGPDELKNLDNGGALLNRLSQAFKGVAVDANSLPFILELIGAKNQVVIPAMIAGLRQAGDEARRLGLLLDDATVKSLDAAGDAATRFGQRMTTAWAGPLAWTLETLNKIGHGVDYFSAGLVGGWEELFQGKKDPRGFSGYIDRFRFGFGAASFDEAMKTQEAIAAAEAAAAKRRQPLDFDLEGGGAAEKELDRMRQQITAKQHAAHVAGLTPEQHKAEVEADLADARAANLHADKRNRPPLEQGRLELLIADLEEQLAQLNRPGANHTGLGALNRPLPTDSLISIGNFLGTNPNSAAEKRLSDIDKRLERIEAYASVMSRRTILFE